MKFRALLLLPLFLSCSIFEADQETSFNEELMLGEWFYEDFDGDFKLIRTDDVDTYDFNDYIYYKFDVNSKCKILHPQRPLTKIDNCYWYFVEGAPNPKFKLMYTRKAYQAYSINEYVVTDTRHLSYLYDIERLTPTNLFLKHNLSAANVETRISEPHDP